MAEGGGQDVQGWRDLRGSGRAQGLLDVAHDLLGACWPVTGLRAQLPLGLAMHRQRQHMRQELPSRRGHEQAGVSLQGEDGAEGACRGGERRERGLREAPPGARARPLPRTRAMGTVSS